MNLDLIEQAGRENLHHVVPDVNSHVLCCAKWADEKEVSVRKTKLICNKTGDNSLKGYTPDNSSKIWNILIKVFMVQWNHDDFLQGKHCF